MVKAAAVPVVVTVERRRRGGGEGNEWDSAGDSGDGGELAARHLWMKDEGARQQRAVSLPDL